MYVEKLGSDPDKLYSFGQLETDLRKYGKYAVIICLLLLGFCVANETEVNDLNEYCERVIRGEKFNFLLNFDDNATYHTHINDVVEDIFQYGYFN